MVAPIFWPPSGSFLSAHPVQDTDDKVRFPINPSKEPEPPFVEPPQIREALSSPAPSDLPSTSSHPGPSATAPPEAGSMDARSETIAKADEPQPVDGAQAPDQMPDLTRTVNQEPPSEQAPLQSPGTSQPEPTSNTVQFVESLFAQLFQELDLPKDLQNEDLQNEDLQNEDLQNGHFPALTTGDDQPPIDTHPPDDVDGANHQPGVIIEKTAESHEKKSGNVNSGETMQLEPNSDTLAGTSRVDSATQSVAQLPPMNQGAEATASFEWLMYLAGILVLGAVLLAYWLVNRPKKQSAPSAIDDADQSVQGAFKKRSPRPDVIHEPIKEPWMEGPPTTDGDDAPFPATSVSSVTSQYQDFRTAPTPSDTASWSDEFLDDDSFSDADFSDTDFSATDSSGEPTVEPLAEFGFEVESGLFDFNEDEDRQTSASSGSEATPVTPLAASQQKKKGIFSSLLGKKAVSHEAEEIEEERRQIEKVKIRDEDLRSLFGDHQTTNEVKADVPGADHLPATANLNPLPPNPAPLGESQNIAEDEVVPDPAISRELAHQLEKTQIENTALKAKLEAIHQELLEFQKQQQQIAEEHQAERKSLQTAVNESTLLADSLRHQQTRLTKEIESLEQKTEDSSHELVSWRQKHTESVHEIESLQTQLSESTGELHASHQRAADLSRELDQASREREILHQQLQAVQAEVAGVHNEQSFLQTALDQSRIVIAEFETFSSQSQVEKDQLREHLSQLQSELNEMKEAAQSSQVEKDQLREHLSQLQSELNEMKGAAQSQVEKTQTPAVDEEAAGRHVKEKFTRLYQRFEEERSRRKQAETFLEQAESEITNIRRELKQLRSERSRS